MVVAPTGLADIEKREALELRPSRLYRVLVAKNALLFWSRRLKCSPSDSKWRAEACDERPLVAHLIVMLVFLRLEGGRTSPMRISKQDVEYIANLSRIKLSEDAKEKFADQMADILDYMEKLNELDTDGVEPMAHATDLRNVFREDKPEKSLEREKSLANSPSQADGFFKVTKVIE